MYNKSGIKISFEITAPVTFAAAYTEGRKSLVIGLEEKRIVVSLYCDCKDDPIVLVSDGGGQTGERIEIDIFDYAVRLYKNGVLEDEKRPMRNICYKKDNPILSPDLSVTVEDTKEDYVPDTDT